MHKASAGVIFLVLALASFTQAAPAEISKGNQKPIIALCCTAENKGLIHCQQVAEVTSVKAKRCRKFIAPSTEQANFVIISPLDQFVKEI